MYRTSKPLIGIIKKNKKNLYFLFELKKLIYLQCQININLISNFKHYEYERS